MTDTTVAATDGGAAPAFDPEVSGPEGEFVASKTDAKPAGEQQAEAPADPNADPNAEKAVEKPPLTPEELEKRLNNQKGATAKERAARRALEREVESAKAAAAENKRQLDELVSYIRAAQNAPAAVDQDDPYAVAQALHAQLQQLQNQHQETRQQLQERLAREAQEAQQAERIGKVKSALDESIASFRDEHPDVDDAMGHLFETRRAEYRALGYPADMIERALANDIVFYTEQLAQSGGDPAEVMYNLANQRGYRPKTNALNTAKAGMEASRSLSQGAGRQSSTLDIAHVAGLSGAAFDEASRKFEEEMIRQERGY